MKKLVLLFRALFKGTHFETGRSYGHYTFHFSNFICLWFWNICLWSSSDAVKCTTLKAIRHNGTTKFHYHCIGLSSTQTHVVLSKLFCFARLFRPSSQPQLAEAAPVTIFRSNLSPLWGTVSGILPSPLRIFFSCPNSHSRQKIVARLKFIILPSTWQSKLIKNMNSLLVVYLTETYSVILNHSFRWFNWFPHVWWLWATFYLRITIEMITLEMFRQDYLISICRFSLSQPLKVEKLSI